MTLGLCEFDIPHGSLLRLLQCGGRLDKRDLPPPIVLDLEWCGGTGQAKDLGTSLSEDMYTVPGSIREHEPRFPSRLSCEFWAPATLD